MHATEAESTIREIERVRRETRRTLHPLWFANIVTGLFFLGATVVAALAGSAAPVNVYWLIGGPLGLTLIIRHALRHERRLGAETRLANPEVLILVALIAGVVVVNRLTDGSFGEVAWVYPVVAGWLGFAALFRDAPMCAAAVALAAIGTAIVAIEPGDAWFWAQLTMALLLLAAGLVEKAGERA